MNKNQKPHILHIIILQHQPCCFSDTVSLNLMQHALNKMGLGSIKPWKYVEYSKSTSLEHSTGIQICRWQYKQRKFKGSWLAWSLTIHCTALTGKQLAKVLQLSHLSCHPSELTRPLLWLGCLPTHVSLKSSLAQEEVQVQNMLARQIPSQNPAHHFKVKTSTDRSIICFPWV